MQKEITAKLKFTIAHRNMMFPCVAWVKRHTIHSLALDAESPSGAPRILRGGESLTAPVELEWRKARDEVDSQLHKINDFLRCGVTWSALTSCRITGDDLLGAILTTVEAMRRHGTNVSQKQSGTSR